MDAAWKKEESNKLLFHLKIKMKIKIKIPENDLLSMANPSEKETQEKEEREFEHNKENWYHFTNPVDVCVFIYANGQ